MDGEVGAGSGGEPLAERAPPAAAPGLQAEASDAENAVEYEVLDGVIDLGYRQLPSLAGVRVSAGVEELELTGNRLDESAIACVLEDADAGARLASLSLRKNLLEGAARVTAAAACAGITTLVLRDNLLSECPPLDALRHLTHLDISYNGIRSLEPLARAPPCLAELYAAKNKIRRAEGIANRASLRVLELGSNRLRTMEGMEGLGALEELWLGSNKITVADPDVLRAMPRLRRLSLQANRLTSTAALAALGPAEGAGGGCGAPLEELSVSQNGVERLEGLDGLPVLLLDAADNPIGSLDGLADLPQLEDLWLNDTKVPVSVLEGLADALRASLPTLSTVYLERTPAGASPVYHQRLVDALPALAQIDAEQLQKHGRAAS